METQKIVNLLGDFDNESSKFETRKWYVISDLNNAVYGEGDENSTTVKFETKNAFKNCAPFTKCVTHINDEHVDNVVNLNNTILMYNLIEYSDNYSDTSGSSWQFKRDESPVTNDGNLGNVSTANSKSFKYKSSFFKPADNNGVFKDVKIAVPLKYLSNFGDL